MARPRSLSIEADRRSAQPVPSEVEDQGLFQRPVVKVPMQLGAAMYRNNRNDLVFTGYSGGNLSFEVVFAGRRALMAAPLVTHVAALVDAERKLAQQRSVPFDPDRLRIPIVLDGAWRTRVWQDDAGWQLRVHQLVVAQWRLTDGGETGRTFGSPPSNSVV